MKKNIFIIILLMLFILSFILYKFDILSSIDNKVYNSIIYFKNDFNTAFMKFITFFGSTKFIIGIFIIILLLSIKYKKFSIIISVILIVEILLNSIIKLIVRRDRPKLINLVVEKTYSFPSGHTMISVVLYGFLIYLLSRSNIKYKKVFIIILSLLVVLIMISRIYLGAHYFSDVFAGLTLGLAYLLFVIGVIERKKLI